MRKLNKIIFNNKNIDFRKTDYLYDRFHNDTLSKIKLWEQCGQT